jgi:hypothetical protein
MDLVIVGPVAAVTFTAAFATTVKRSGTSKISNHAPKLMGNQAKTYRFSLPYSLSFLFLLPYSFPWFSLPYSLSLSPLFLPEKPSPVPPSLL